MAKTMKAAVVRAFGRPLTIDAMPVPTPGPGEVLIKIVASGVCHTDLHGESIFDVVLKRITVRGSIVGTRADLAEAIAFAAEAKVRAHVHEARLDEINRVLSELKAGTIEGRVVLRVA
jgi:D-arabinose 1-dehydrogenase-like Zn-dependent alcohol dehydrogenase